MKIKKWFIALIIGLAVIIPAVVVPTTLLLNKQEAPKKITKQDAENSILTIINQLSEYDGYKKELIINKTYSYELTNKIYITKFTMKFSGGLTTKQNLVCELIDGLWNVDAKLLPVDNKLPQMLNEPKVKMFYWEE